MAEEKTEQHTPSTNSNDVENEPLSAPPEQKTTLPPPPDGGLQAWLMVVGAFTSNFCTFGYLNSFG